MSDSVKDISKVNIGPQLAVRSNPFPSWINDYDIDTSNSTYGEFRSGEQLYELLCEYICQNATNSFRLKPKPNVSQATKALQKLARLAKDAKSKKENENKKDESKENNDKKEEKKDDNEDEDDSKVSASLGLGLHKFEFKNEIVFALHQTIGQPQAGGYSCRAPTFHESLVMFVKGKKRLDFLKEICTAVIEKNETKKDSLYFKIYRFNCDQQYWRNSGKKIARDIDTIILPEKTLDTITGDIERFLDEKSVKWYFEHGIPYKRSYLFFGVPGSGKSSMIQALASKYERNLCFLQATHPKMTDDAFKACIQSAPSNSLIVLEDIDALFNKDRSKKHRDCPLTFSGLLNGLDGVGNPDGQIFILTTNFVDRLDDALIRSGRVDIHIKFPNATDKQLEKMFLLFYPNDNKLAKDFVQQIRKYFAKGISMAATQQWFIQNMFADPQIIVDKVSELGERLDVERELNEKSKLKEEKPKENDIITLLQKALPNVLDSDDYKQLTEQLKKVCKSQNEKDSEIEKKEKELAKNEKDNKDELKEDKNDNDSTDSSFIVIDKNNNDNNNDLSKKDETQKKDESKKDEPKKDEPKKEESKKDTKKEVKKVNTKKDVKKDTKKVDNKKKDTKKDVKKDTKKDNKKDVKKDGIKKDTKKGTKNVKKN